MNTYFISITPKANPRFARGVGSVKAKPVARLECLATTPIGSFGSGQCRDPAPGPENIRCRGRSLGTCCEEILPDSQRCDQEFVFVGPPISGRHRQTRMQKRLSARSSSFVESVGSGGGSDSALKPVTPDCHRKVASALATGYRIFFFWFSARAGS